MSVNERMKKAFSKRMSSGKWPPFFAFDAEGVIFIGRITGQHVSTYWNPDKPLKVMHAVDVKTGEEFSMPTVRGVQAAWNSLDVRVGDYVFLEYLGETKLKRGAGSVKSYNVSKLTEEEYTAIEKGEDPDIAPIKLTENVDVKEEAPREIVHEDDIIKDFLEQTEKEGSDSLVIARALAKKYKISMKEMRQVADKALLEKGSKEVEERAQQQKEDKKTDESATDTKVKVAVRTLVSDVLEFYDEIDKERLAASLKASDIDVTIEEALEICKDTIVVKGDTITSKPE